MTPEFYNGGFATQLLWTFVAFAAVVVLIVSAAFLFDRWQLRRRDRRPKQRKR